MKPFTHFLTKSLLIGAASATILVSCSDDDPVTPTESYDYTAILGNYSDVVVGTYSDLDQSAAALLTAVQAIQANAGSQSHVDAACEAWIAARSPWEKSEAFLFGPAETLSLDPSLDSWPVDRGQLDQVLASSEELTSDYVRNGLAPTLRGFHTVEYLLFREGQPRNAADFTAREMEYLIAATTVLTEDAETLHTEWSMTDGYAAEFASAGDGESRYLTQEDAMIEMVDGMIGIADEVANGKIADPYDENNTELVESQFSYNSLLDFADNVRSIQNAWNGTYGTLGNGTSLLTYVTEKDPTIAAAVTSLINDAILAVENIPAPFRNNLDKSAEIEAAQTAINTIFTTLEDDVKPLITE